MKFKLMSFILDLKKILNISFFLFFSIIVLFILFFFQTGLQNDIFIYLRYAGNLNNGLGYTFNPGQSPVLGTPGIFLTFILSLITKLFPNNINNVTIDFFKITSIILFVVLSVFVNKLNERISYKFYILCSFVWLFLVTPFLSLISYGTDLFLSAVFIFLYILSCLKYSSKPDNKNLAIIILTAYLAYLTRFDNIIFVLGFAYIYFKYHCRFQKKELLYYGSIFVTPFLIDLLIKTIIFNVPVPLFYLARFGNVFNSIVTFRVNLNNFLLFLIYSFPFILFIILTYKKSAKVISAAILIPVLLKIFLMFFINQNGGNYIKYYYQDVLLLFALSAILFSIFSDSFILNKEVALLFFKERIIYIAFFLMLIVIVYAGTTILSVGTKEVEADKKFKKNSLAISKADANKILGELFQELPENTTVGVFGVNEVPYEKNIHIIDLSGSHNSEVALNGLNNYILSGKGPDLIIFNETEKDRPEELLSDNKIKKKYIYLESVLEKNIFISRENPMLVKKVLVFLRQEYRNHN